MQLTRFASFRRKSIFKWIVASTGFALLTGIACLIFLAEKPAPEVSFVTLSGERISSDALHGKVVMVNFWSTSCAICIHEMPEMADTYTRYHAQGLEFIAVAMRGDAPNYVLDFAETRKLPFKVALDLQGELARSFGEVSQTPTTFVIDKRGIIIKRYLGQPDFPALHRLLQQALAV